MKIVESLEDLIARYGMPHKWDNYINFLNKWRLVAEHIQIRVLCDVALRCPDKKLRDKALQQFKDPNFDLQALDREWPGRGCFEYDWEGLTKMRREKERAQ